MKTSKNDKEKHLTTFFLSYTRGTTMKSDINWLLYRHDNNNGKYTRSKSLEKTKTNSKKKNNNIGDIINKC